MQLCILVLFMFMACSIPLRIQSYLHRFMQSQKRLTSYKKSAEHEIPISELLRGNFGRAKNGKLRQGPSIEQTKRLREYNRRESARIPNSAYSHLKLAQHLWSEVVEPDDICIDATCGNGYDSAIIAQLLNLKSDRVGESGKLYCMDVQELALQNTKLKLLEELQLIDNGDGCSLKDNESLFDHKVHLLLKNHRTFPEEIEKNSVKLIVYNLGYLPGGDKAITPRTEDTLESIKNAIPLLKSRGLLSVLCYRMHSYEAKEESMEIEKLLSKLDPESYRSFSHTPINWPLAPLLITTYKLPKTQISLRTT